MLRKVSSGLGNVGSIFSSLGSVGSNVSFLGGGQSWGSPGKYLKVPQIDLFNWRTQNILRRRRYSTVNPQHYLVKDVLLACVGGTALLVQSLMWLCLFPGD
jgi:hypothetical protein